MSRWREIAAPIIYEVIERYSDSDMRTLRKALRDAYPFGDRKYHPYKIWCDEMKRQLGRPIANRKSAMNQTDMFGEASDIND